MRSAPRPRRVAAGLGGAAGGLLALAASGCASLPGEPGATLAQGPAFSPERFFTGATEGRGVLKIVASRRRAVHVVGAGRIDPDGALILSQRVQEGDKPPRERRWRIRQVSPGRYAGTLSDAAGPVTGEAAGNMLHLRFRMAGGFAAEQRLYLQPDGRTALNRLTVRKLGVVVAVLDETIRKATECAIRPRARRAGVRDGTGGTARTGARSGTPATPFP